MRSRALFALIFVTVGCGDNNKSATPVDSSVPMIDAPLDANPSDLIGAAKATADGTGLSLPISFAKVTYLKPQLGNPTNDPAGFTIQAQQMGPALFVAVDPSTTTPPLARGDVVSFRITELTTIGGQKRVAALDTLMRHSQGADVTTLSQEVTAATDLVTGIDNYDSELVDVTGTIATFASSGSGFEKSQLTTTGMAASAAFVVRVPSTLRDAIDMAPTCTITLKDTPVGRFNAETQLSAFTPSDISLAGCPAPTVVSAIDISATSARITFSRNIAPASVMADGSQFTFDNGLTATAATVSGRTVTVTTNAQAIGTTYTVTVATTVTDLQGTALVTPNTATFSGFIQPASVKLNEVNAHITANCDLLELRVTASGSMGGIQIKERNVVVHTFGALDVVKNDIIVLHFASGSATCNPGTSVSETTIAGQPVGTFARNYDTAFDIFTTDGGITDTDNVISVLDKLGAIVDAVLIENNDNSTAGDSETAAATVAAANQWQMVGGGVPTGGFADANFTPHAVIDSDAPETVNHTGANSESLRRVDDTDDNDKADWAQGANTWGLINAGQAAL